MVSYSFSSVSFNLFTWAENFFKSSFVSGEADDELEDFLLDNTDGFEEDDEDSWDGFEEDDELDDVSKNSNGLDEDVLVALFCEENEGLFGDLLPIVSFARK